MARSVYERFGKTTVTGVRSIERTHIVTGGETIPHITAVEYPTAGYDSELWRQVAEENDILDLDDVAAGDVLVMPAPKASET